MPEENRNSEIPKQKNKSRVFRIGLYFIIIGIIITGIYLLTLFLAFALRSPDFGPGFVAMTLVGLVGSPLLCIGLFLIFLSLFLQTKKITQKIIWVFVIILVFLGPMQIYFYIIRYSPITKLAVVSKNESFCRIVIPSSSRDECYNVLSRLKENVDLCEKINNSRDRDYCYLYLVAKTKNTVICEKVESLDLSSVCYRLAE